MTQVFQIVKYLVGTILVAWLVTTDQINLNSVKELTHFAVITSTVLSFLSLLLSSARLKILLTNQHFNVSFIKLFKLNMLGIFYSLFLPGGVSGDVVKGYHLLQYRNEENSKTNIVSTLCLDRYLGLLSMFILASIMVTLPNGVPSELANLSRVILFITIGLSAAPFLIYRVFVHFHDHHMLTKYDYIYINAMKIKVSLQKFINWKLLMLSIFYGVIGHIFTILIIWIISLNLQSSVGLINSLIISPLAFAVNLLPVSPGGIGVGEKAFEELFLLYGVAGGATVFFVSRFFMYLPGAFGFLVFLQNKEIRNEIDDEKNPLVSTHSN